MDEELDPRKVDELHVRLEATHAVQDVLDEMIQAGVVRHDPETGKYFAMMDREEGERRLKEFRSR
jgi:hypothetical protein